MALNIKNPDAARLAHALVTGASLTDAVIAALQARLALVQRQQQRPALLSEVAMIQKFVRSLPPRDVWSSDDILGYVAFGLPG